jgi:hypothetical protein
MSRRRRKTEYKDRMEEERKRLLYMIKMKVNILINYQYS